MCNKQKLSLLLRKGDRSSDRMPPHLNSQKYETLKILIFFILLSTILMDSAFCQHYRGTNYYEIMGIVTENGKPLKEVKIEKRRLTMKSGRNLIVKPTIIQNDATGKYRVREFSQFDCKESYTPYGSPVDTTTIHYYIFSKAGYVKKVVFLIPCISDIDRYKFHDGAYVDKNGDIINFEILLNVEMVPEGKGNPNDTLLGYLVWDEKAREFVINKHLNIALGKGIKDGLLPKPRILNTVQFESGSSKLLPSSLPELDSLVRVLNTSTISKIEINGHTDSTGNEKANIELSQKRADAVKKYLMSKGINPDRIIATGFGSAKPISPNSTEESRRRNRRVEAILLLP